MEREAQMMDKETLLSPTGKPQEQVLRDVIDAIDEAILPLRHCVCKPPSPCKPYEYKRYDPPPKLGLQTVEISQFQYGTQGGSVFIEKIPLWVYQLNIYGPHSTGACTTHIVELMNVYVVDYKGKTYAVDFWNGYRIQLPGPE